MHGPVEFCGRAGGGSSVGILCITFGGLLELRCKRANGDDPPYASSLQRYVVEHSRPFFSSQELSPKHQVVGYVVDCIYSA